MINKLTTEQEKQIPFFINKWVGMAAKPMDEVKSISYVKKLYASMKEKEPLVIIADSPFSASVMAAMFWSLSQDKKNKSRLGSPLDSKLGFQLYSQLDSQLHSQLMSPLYSQLGSQLDSQLDSQLRSQLRSQLQEINNEWYLSIYWLVWCGWYEYGKYIGVKFSENIYDLFVNFISEVNFIIPYKGIAFISRKPEHIHWKEAILHSETEAAVRYKDGYSMWMLNGVRMEEKHVMTPPEKLDAKEIINEKNVEVRRELIRKIGVERFIQSAGAKVLDKSGSYELLSVRLSDEVPDARYLKMKNPSIGVWHVEGVEGNNIQEALNFRARNLIKSGENWSPEVLT